MKEPSKNEKGVHDETQRPVDSGIRPGDDQKQFLGIFDKNREASRRSIAGASDEHLMKTWTLLSAGTTILSMPRFAVLRSFCINHIIHHRTPARSLSA